MYLNDAIVDYVAGTVRPMPDLGFPVVDLYPSPDGERLIVGTGTTGVGLLDAATMHWISRPNAAQAGLVGYLTTWSDDGALVASVSNGRPEPLGRADRWTYLGQRRRGVGRGPCPSPTDGKTPPLRG